MQRLVDADEIKKREKDVILANGAKHRCFDTTMLYELPPVDAVEVVRCKDCEFSLTPEWDSDEVYCTKHNNWFKFNGYCHLGRKEDGNN